MVNMPNLLSQLVAIKEQSGISVSQILLRTNNKYSKTTVVNFFQNKTANPNMETFVDLANACGADVILQTESSKRAEIRGDVEDIRLEYAEKLEELDRAKAEIKRLRDLHDEQLKQNSELSSAVKKQQDTIDRFISRMEKAEDAMYRKDARIVELSKACGMWDVKQEQSK